MVDIYSHYEGGLRCISTHGPSRASLATDAPADNYGKGGSFSPTDLVATALGTCMLTTMGILAHKRGWLVDGMDVHVKKEMTKALPRRIDRLPVELSIPASIAAAFDESARKELENSAHTCPVRLSLLPAIEVPITFRWGG